MNAGFVAKIEVPALKGKCNRGTGYPIAKDLIITARHVVDFEGVDQNANIQITWPSLPDPDRPGECLKIEVKREKIVYPGDQSVSGCDVALIQCSLLPEMNDELPILLPPGMLPPETWHTKGYPDVSNKRDDLQTLCSVSGRCETLRTNCILELNTNTDPVKRHKWAGLSGAPVFSDSWLVGIISDTNPEIRNQLEAVFLPYLIRKDRDFREKIGVRPQADFSRAIDVLKQGEAGKKACAALAAQLPECHVEPEVLVTALKDLQPLGRLLEIIHNAQ